jgi:hypothetical protein
MYMYFEVGWSIYVLRPAQEYFIYMDWFFFFCLFIYSCTSNFSAIWRLSPLPVIGLQILAYARRSGPLSREESLLFQTYYDTGSRFIRSPPKDRHPRPTVRFEPPMQGSSDQFAVRSNHCTTLRAVEHGGIFIMSQLL